MIASRLRMHAVSRSPIAGLAALALCLPPSLPAQQASPGGSALAGGWSGWAKLTNEWPGLVCRYDSGTEAQAVHLELDTEGGRLHGSLAIDVPAAAGSGCPPLRKRYSIAEVTETAGTVAFTDSGGNEWTLASRRQGEVLQGLVAWRAGGAEQPLAQGFTGPDGRTPLARLSGEVRLRRAGAATELGASASGSAPPSSAAAGAPGKTSLGTHAKHLAIVLGANVVGLGLVYGVNALGKGSSSSGAVTCSPRLCHVGLPGQPCFCDPNEAANASCGTTEGGVDLNGACDGVDLPCHTGLSCDILQGATGGVCEDPAAGGRCP